MSIRYRTTDNLATFLRNITVRLYDPNGHLVTTIASYDTQSAGENYVMILPSSFEGLSDGNYSCAIKAFDEAGNGTSESVALTIDTTPPSIDQANITPNPMTSNSTSMNFNTNISESSIVTIKLINKSTNIASGYVAQATASEGEDGASASYAWTYDSAYGSTGPIPP